MLEAAKQLDDPANIAMAEVNIGVELERARQVRDAINVLEHARDTSFDASKYIAALANAYLARAYASAHDNVRFERTVETALNLALKVKNYGDGTDAVFHSVSGVLAERSYGYLEIGNPEKTLAMKDEIMRQIKLDRNTRLHVWILLGWARPLHAQSGRSKRTRSTSILPAFIGIAVTSCPSSCLRTLGRPGKRWICRDTSRPRLPRGIKGYQLILFFKRNPPRDMNPGRRGHSSSASMAEAF